MIWDYTNRFGITAVNLITSIILARLLNPADFGMVGISMAVNGIAGIFVNLGFVSAIVQSKELDNKSLSTVFFLNLIIALLMYGLIFTCAYWIENYFLLTGLELIIKVSALSFIVNALNVVPSALLIRNMKFKQMAILSIVSSILSGSLGVYLALEKSGVWSIIYQQLIGGTMIMIGTYIFTKWLPILYFRFYSIKNMMSFGIYMFLSGLLDGIYSRIDVFLIAKVFNPTSLGLYTRAQSFDNMIRTLSSGSLLNVLFPAFAKIRDDKEKLISVYYHYFRLLSFLFCLLAGIFYLSSEQLFLVLFGSKWHLSAIYFKILVIAGFSYPLSSLSLSIIEARGNSKSFFIVELIKKALFLPTYFIAFYWGIIPFLLSSVFVMYLSTFMNIRFLKYELDISIWQTIKYLSAYYIPTLFSVLLVEMLNFPTSLQETVIEVFLKVGLFIFIYIFINIKIKNKGFNYSLDLIRN